MSENYGCSIPQLAIYSLSAFGRSELGFGHDLGVYMVHRNPTYVEVMYNWNFTLCDFE